MKDWIYRNKPILKNRGFKIITIFKYRLLLLLSAIGVLAILMIAVSYTASSMLEEHGVELIPHTMTIIIEHKISNQTMQMIEDYINDNFFYDLKGGDNDDG